jgi:hypothetical protein
VQSRTRPPSARVGPRPRCAPSNTHRQGIGCINARRSELMDIAAAVAAAQPWANERRRTEAPTHTHTHANTHTRRHTSLCTHARTHARATIRAQGARDGPSPHARAHHGHMHSQTQRGSARIRRPRAKHAGHLAILQGDPASNTWRPQFQELALAKRCMDGHSHKR